MLCSVIYCYVVQVLIGLGVLAYARSTEEASPLISIVIGVVVNNTYYKCEIVALGVFLSGDHLFGPRMPGALLSSPRRYTSLVWATTIVLGVVSG